MTYHVLIPDNVDPAAIEILKVAKGLNVKAPGNLPRDETLAAIPEADALIIRSSTRADAELLGAGARLKVIARAGVGVDNVDLGEATRRGVAVMNTPDGNTVSTAEHAFGLMLALARHIPQAHQSLASGRWDRKLYQGVELRGKTLGIVGLGRIGRAIAARANAFGMRVIAHDPYVIDGGDGVEMVPLDALFAAADFITLHAVITDETRHLVDAASLAKMKHGVRIINAARGALVDEVALAEAIQSGQVAGAAVDVYGQEPPPADHPLIRLAGVVHTPHLAASTSDAQVEVAVQAARQIVAALLEQDYQNVVNPEVLG